MRSRPLACIVGGVRAAIVLLLMCGCAESRFMVDPAFDGIPQEQLRAQDPAPAIDSFWLQQAVSEANKPPVQRPRSISLGYIGDGPLTGGVMRDTPIAPQNPSYVDYAQQQPTGGCSCAVRTPPAYAQ